MSVSPAVADRINRVVDMLDRYVARHQALVLELEQQTQLATDLAGYEQMRAASNAKVARAKIAMYEPEIELLRNQLERWADEANIRSPAEGSPSSEVSDTIARDDADLPRASSVASGAQTGA